MKILVPVILVCVIAACDARRGRMEGPECDANSTLITDSSIGPLHIGEAVPALRVRCGAVLDTTVQGVAGIIDTARTLRLVVVGVPVLIHQVNGRVTALAVESPVFQTVDSVGVTTSIARFRNKPGVRIERASDMRDIVLSDRTRCGMRFHLSGSGSPTVANVGDPPLTGSVLASWPDSIVAKRVVVSGCFGRTDDIRVDSISEHLADSARAADSLVAAPMPNILTPTPQPVQPPPLRPLPAPPVAARADTSAIAATPRELNELRAQLIVPVQGITRSQLRDDYTQKRGGRTHEAIDIPAARGTPVLSATDGRLLKLFSSKPGGLMVYAGDASDRFVLMYGHLDRYADGLKEGMVLKQGQIIGYVGTTGNAPPNLPHLHFAIARGRPRVAWWRGTPVNPFLLLTQ